MIFENQTTDFTDGFTVGMIWERCSLGLSIKATVNRRCEAYAIKVLEHHRYIQVKVTYHDMHWMLIEANAPEPLPGRQSG